MNDRVEETLAGCLGDVGDHVTEVIDGDDNPGDAVQTENWFIDPTRDEFFDGPAYRICRARSRRQGCRNGRKDISSVKRRTGTFNAKRTKGIHIEMPQSRAWGLSSDLCQQPIIWREKKMIVNAHHGDVARSADAGVHYSDMHRTAGKIRVRTGDPKTGLRRPVRNDFMGEINNAYGRRRGENPPFHHADKGIAQTEIGSEGDDSARHEVSRVHVQYRVSHDDYGIILDMSNAHPDPTQSFRLDGRIALVTGASSGIGRAIALAFSAAGAAVALTARRGDRLESLATEIQQRGGKAIAVALDVTDRTAITRAFDEVQSRLGLPDVILNNAGIAKPALFLKTDAESLESTMATNFTAAWDVSQEAARRLVAAKKRGSIINITSVLGIGVGPGYAAYAASKAALAHATRAMALEFIRYGIRVNGIAPGWFVTEMNEAFFATEEGVAYLKKTPPGRAGRLEELAGPALLLASDAGSFVNGVILPVDGAHHVALV